MILIDTSAWIDFFRASPGRATTEVRRLIDERGSELSMCEPVAMEILAGASTDHRLGQLTQLVNGLPSLPVEPSLDFRSAAEIFRRTQVVGLTVRTLNDCLIAAVVLRHGATLVHKDRDFEAIAEAVPLQQLSLR